MICPQFVITIIISTTLAPLHRRVFVAFRKQTQFSHPITSSTTSLISVLIEAKPSTYRSTEHLLQPK